MYVTITKYLYLMLDCERRAEMERLTEWYDDGEYKGAMVKEQFGDKVLETLFDEWDEGYV